MREPTQNQREYALQIGSAFLRVWRRGQGLIVDQPLCAVRERASGAIIAFGHEAQAMEDRLSEDREFVRAFWNESLVDREVLRIHIESVLQTVSQASSGELSWWRLPFSFTQAVSPHRSPLHTKYSERILRESGLWFLQSKNAYSGLIGEMGPKSCAGIADCGFSAARAAIYGNGQVLALAQSEGLGLRSLCEAMVQAELEESGCRFVASSFFAQEWHIAHEAFDERRGRSIVRPLTKKTVEKVMRRWQQGVERLVLRSVATAPPVQQAALRQSGIQVIGGAARLFTPLRTIDAEIPLHETNQPTYAALRTLFSA